jgi:hypothetical protein
MAESNALEAPSLARKYIRNKTTDAFDRKVGFKVAKKRCDECLFSKAKIVSGDRRDEILKECDRKGTYFICHKFTIRGEAAVCKGFFDEGKNQVCRVAERLGLVVYVDPVERKTQRMG